MQRSERASVLPYAYIFYLVMIDCRPVCKEPSSAVKRILPFPSAPPHSLSAPSLSNLDGILPRLAQDIRLHREKLDPSQ